jgi:hypothetical protein
MQPGAIRGSSLKFTEVQPAAGFSRDFPEPGSLSCCKCHYMCFRKPCDAIHHASFSALAASTAKHNMVNTAVFITHECTVMILPASMACAVGVQAATSRAAAPPLRRTWAQVPRSATSCCGSRRSRSASRCVTLTPSQPVEGQCVMVAVQGGDDI